MCPILKFLFEDQWSIRFLWNRKFHVIVNKWDPGQPWTWMMSFTCHIEQTQTGKKIGQDGKNSSKNDSDNAQYGKYT